MNQESHRIEPPQTRSGWVDDRLRAAILTGELAPGEKLHGHQLSSRWGVSVTPLREAFQRLAGEGLVSIAPQKGARVAELDLQQVAEYYELRLILEPKALEMSLECAYAQADTTFHDEVRAALDALESATPPMDTLTTHRDFHLVLLSRCPNRELVRLCATLYNQTQRFRIGVAAKLEHVDLIAEHRVMTDAVIRGDAADAVRLLTDHIQRAAAQASSH